MDGRAPWYDSTATIGGISNGGLPNITGQLKEGLRVYNTSGAFYAISSYKRAPVDGNYTSTNTAGFSASRSSSIYGDYDRVIPANTNTLWCIKH